MTISVSSATTSPFTRRRTSIRGALRRSAPGGRDCIGWCRFKGCTLRFVDISAKYRAEPGSVPGRLCRRDHGNSRAADRVEKQRFASEDGVVSDGPNESNLSDGIAMQAFLAAPRIVLG